MKYLCFLFLSATLLSCPKPNDDMPERLKNLSRELFFIPENLYASKTKIAFYDQLLLNTSPTTYNQYRFEKARHLLYSGQTRKAIELFQVLIQEKNQKMTLLGLDASLEDRLEEYLALAYFRLGEQENCLHHHHAASCILPLSQSGIHQHTEGATRALEIYQNILKDNPGDLNCRWLLNITYMTLGKYPEDVPKEWLIPDTAFDSEYSLKKFTDIAFQSNVAVNKLSGGVVLEDFNQDGWLDLMVSSWFPDHQIQLFLNNQEGVFTEKTQTSGLLGITGGLNMIQADYNNDGFIDVLVLRGAWLDTLGKFPNSLLKNNGDGTFSDVTKEAGLLSFYPTQTATWNDFNRDGWLDLFIGNETTSSENIFPCELYLNNQDGTFTEIAQKADIQINHKSDFYFIKGVTSGDYDNDGWADIYVSTIDAGKPNLLFRNKGIEDQKTILFEEVSAKVGLQENVSSFPTWFWDYDNDGHLDLFAAGYRHNPNQLITHDIAAEYLGLSHSAEKAKIYRNQGDGTFQNISKQLHVDKILYAMGANYGDLDNDGYLDMYLSTGEISFESVIPNRMFRNNQGAFFQDVTTAGGFGHLQKGHAISFGDFDQDGDQDIYAVMGGAFEGDVYYNALFQNPYQNINNWIGIILQGNVSNRFGIGCRIEVTITEKDKKRKIFREVGPGGSFGASPLRTEIGIGQATQVDEIKIYWNALKSKTQTIKKIKPNQYIYIQEGKSNVNI